jgi:hypothetical protein
MTIGAAFACAYRRDLARLPRKAMPVINRSQKQGSAAAASQSTKSFSSEATAKPDDTTNEWPYVSKNGCCSISSVASIVLTNSAANFGFDAHSEGLVPGS